MHGRSSTNRWSAKTRIKTTVTPSAPSNGMASVRRAEARAKEAAPIRGNSHMKIMRWVR